MAPDDRDDRPEKRHRDEHNNCAQRRSIEGRSIETPRSRPGPSETMVYSAGFDGPTVLAGGLEQLEVELDLHHVTERDDTDTRR
jgi:hypothetical protein